MVMVCMVRLLKHRRRRSLISMQLCMSCTLFDKCALSGCLFDRGRMPSIMMSSLRFLFRLIRFGNRIPVARSRRRSIWLIPTWITRCVMLIKGMSVMNVWLIILSKFLKLLRIRNILIPMVLGLPGKLFHRPPQCPFVSILHIMELVLLASLVLSLYHIHTLSLVNTNLAKMSTSQTCRVRSGWNGSFDKLSPRQAFYWMRVIAVLLNASPP